MLYLYIFISVIIMFIISFSSKKEILEIIQADDNIFFLLSGDEYLVAFIENGSSKEELILSIINRYKNELSTIVDRVVLVNNRCYDFERELNSLIRS